MPSQYLVCDFSQLSRNVVVVPHHETSDNKECRPDTDEKYQQIYADTGAKIGFHRCARFAKGSNIESPFRASARRRMTIGGRLRLFPFRRNLRPPLARGGPQMRSWCPLPKPNGTSGKGNGFIIGFGAN